MHPRSLILLGTAGLLASVGCTAPEFVLLRGAAYTLEEGADPALAFSGIVGVPDLDDDNDNGRPDWDDASIDESDDTSPFFIPSDLWRRIGRQQVLRLTLPEGDAELRIWNDGALILGDNDGDAALLSFDVPRPEDTAPLQFDVQLRRPGRGGLVVMERLKPDGTVLETTELPLMAASLVMNTHSQPAERVMAVAVDFGGTYENRAMIADYEDSLGDRFETIDGADYEGDVWVQDEIEFATYSAPDTRIDLVIDSIRDRGLDDVAEELFEDSEFLVQTWGSGFASSQDSFGNLEATPPITVDGVHYPFGRVYWGDAGGQAQVAEELQEMFRGMTVQAPFELDTSWLCVGHVDEFMSWIPDPTAPKGWRLVYTDIPGAWELLESMDPATPLPRYQQAHGFATVGEILADNAVRALNEDLWDDYLEPNLEILRREAGVTDEDILWLPGLFEVASGCGGGTAALIPGMANLIVSNFPGETPMLFMADPFLRTDGGRQGDDPMISRVRELFGSGFDVHFLDDFWVYHYGLGEVHCGTNVIRTPVQGWWNLAGPLLSGN